MFHQFSFFHSWHLDEDDDPEGVFSFQYLARTCATVGHCNMFSPYLFSYFQQVYSWLELPQAADTNPYSGEDDASK